jgi:hypothetical protein
MDERGKVASDATEKVIGAPAQYSSSSSSRLGPVVRNFRLRPVAKAPGGYVGQAVLECVGRARLQSARSRRHVRGSWLARLRREAAPPSRGCDTASKLDLFFPPMRDWFLPLVQEKPIQSEETEMHPISLQRPIPGSAMLRKLLDQASAERK